MKSVESRPSEMQPWTGVVFKIRPAYELGAHCSDPIALIRESTGAESWIPVSETYIQKGDQVDKLRGMR